MGRLHLQFKSWTSAALLVVGLYLPARAQDPDDMQRGVGRISMMNGQVSVQRGDSGDWVAGVLNAPLIAGDRIGTAQSSRAEIEFDSSNLFRLGANAEVHLTQLETARFQMEFARGIMTYRVLRPTDAYVEIDTPSVSVRPTRVGSYRIAVNENGETEIAARSGEVEVFSPKGSQWVNAGQMMIARGDPSDPEFQVVSAPAPDEWDRWNDSRDQMIMQSNSARYMGPGEYGAEDMDQYGNWVNVEGYGNCYRPTVAADWAPYRYGRWVWLDWYGWTWVPEDPWGWAPYHYGRWFYQASYGWLWYPGLHGVRHYWSPALVAFFGFGGGGFGAGFGFGFGNVGWVALAPYEVFHPWWGRGFYGGFNRGFGVTNVNIAGVYRNAAIAHGVSSIGAEDFRNGRFGGIVHPGAEQLRGAGLVHGQLGIQPGHSNLAFSERAASFTPRASATTNGRFFTHQQPAAANRVPFAQMGRAAEQGSRPSGNTVAGRSAAAINDRPAGAAQGGMNRPGTNGPGNGGGFSRFGSPGQGSNPPAGGTGQGGWRGQAPQTQNSRPPQTQNSPDGARRFGSPGNSQQQPQSRPNAPSYNPPAQQHNTAPSYNPPARNSGGSGGGNSGGSRPSGGGSSSGGHSSGSSGGHHK
jgi:hypothetical protein